MNNKTKGILLMLLFTALSIYFFETYPDTLLPFVGLLGAAVIFLLAIFGITGSDKHE